MGSGIRYDMVMADKQHGSEYLHELAGHHVSGQLKLAPEHSEPEVLAHMRKPHTHALLDFKEAFERESKEQGLDQYLSYYIIAAHPGCTKEHMIDLQNFAAAELGILPEQVQIFTPTPSTYSSLMYFTETDPFTGEKIFVEKSETGKMQQKALITGWRGKQPRAGGIRKDSDTDRKSERERARRACGDEPRRETRVVRDDDGRFFMNRKPEGWVDKKSKDRQKPYRSAREDSGSKSDEHDRKSPRAEGERPFRERRPYDPDRRPPRAEGDKPFRERKPYDPDHRPQRAEGNKPFRERKPYDPDRRSPREKSHDRGQKPYTKTQDKGRKPFPSTDKKDKHG